jgi:hypothetical protein
MLKPSIAGWFGGAYYHMALAMHIFHTPSRCYIDCMDWLNITYRTHRQFPNVTPVQALIPDMIKLTQRMLVRTWQRSYWETIWQGTLGWTLFWRLPQYPHLWIGISWYGPCFPILKVVTVWIDSNNSGSICPQSFKGCINGHPHHKEMKLGCLCELMFYHIQRHQP